MPQILNPDAEYPFIQDGLDFLREKEVLPHAQYVALSRTQKLRVIGSSAIQTALQASKLKALVMQSVTAGESESEFHERIRDHVGVMRSEANTILRTNTKQASIEGLTKTLEKSHIQAAFPYVMFVSTHDGRTRHDHAEHDGEIVLVGSPEYDKLLELLHEYQCRCSLIPLSAKQAKARGVDVPDEYLSPAPVNAA